LPAPALPAPAALPASGCGLAAVVLPAPAALPAAGWGLAAATLVAGRAPVVTSPSVAPGAGEDALLGTGEAASLALPGWRTAAFSRSPNVSPGTVAAGVLLLAGGGVLLPGAGEGVVS
jgi:hypothetical protein